MFVYQLFVMAGRPLVRAFLRVAAGCWRGRGSESRAAGEGLPREAVPLPPEGTIHPRTAEIGRSRGIDLRSRGTEARFRGRGVQFGLCWRDTLPALGSRALPRGPGLFPGGHGIASGRSNEKGEPFVEGFALIIDGGGTENRTPVHDSSLIGISRLSRWFGFGRVARSDTLAAS